MGLFSMPCTKKSLHLYGFPGEYTAPIHSRPLTVFDGSEVCPLSQVVRFLDVSVFLTYGING
jgi:hypothetical protein